MPKPNIQFSTPEKYWDDAKIGDECTSPSYTFTAERIDAYAELTGDFTPVHVDEEYANASHFGCRVAHGLMGLSVADGLKTQCEYRFLPGMSLGWTWDFLLPIKISDVLHIRFWVESMRASKSKPGWGIVFLPAELLNAQGQVYQKGEHRLIGGEAYAADATLYSQDGRNASRESILARVSEWTMSQASVEACCAALDAAGVPAAPVQTIDKVLADPQTLARDMVVEQDHPVLGKIRLPNLPFRFSGCDTSPSGPAPLLGQHNREIAASAGYSEQEIDTFVNEGVLYAEASANHPGKEKS